MLSTSLYDAFPDLKAFSTSLLAEEIEQQQHGQTQETTAAAGPSGQSEHGGPLVNTRLSQA